MREGAGYEPFLDRDELEPDEGLTGGQGTLLERLNWWLWSAYGEGCDQWQREALIRWRDQSWDLGRESEPNPYCEYPRLSNRFPRQRSQWMAFLDSYFCCDTICEQVFRPE